MSSSLSHSFHSLIRLSGGAMSFKDAASAAKAAADSAKNAMAAAQEAAQLAQTGSCCSNHNNFSLGMGNRCSENAEMRPDVLDINRRLQSYNFSGCAHTDINFDESDCNEDDMKEQEPWSGPPSFDRALSNANSTVHPKLPDYDTLAARFEALKYHKT